MTACLWDGARRRDGSEFCSERCETRYADWYRAREEVVDDVVAGPVGERDGPPAGWAAA